MTSPGFPHEFSSSIHSALQVSKRVNVVNDEEDTEETLRHTAEPVNPGYTAAYSRSQYKRVVSLQLIAAAADLCFSQLGATLHKFQHRMLSVLQLGRRPCAGEARYEARYIGGGTCPFDDAEYLGASLQAMR